MSIFSRKSDVDFGHSYLFLFKKKISFKDILDSKEDLNLQIPENLCRLPDTFPDELSADLEEDDQPGRHRIKMSSIHTIWKKICLACQM